ncbi:MAG TPA: RNA polymerase sigma-70 factor [Puia sp.]
MLNTDHDLFRQIAMGDEAAFGELFRRYDRRIYPFVLRMIKSEVQAEEITHEIFIKIWKTRERLPSIDQPEAYIFTIAARHTLDQIKKRLNENRMLQRLSTSQSPVHHDPEEMLLFKDKEALVRQAVDQLPPQQKAVYLLSRQQGLSYEEIAQELGISANTVRNHLVKALQSMRSWLDQQDHIPSVLLACAYILLYSGKN